MRSGNLLSYPSLIGFVEWHVFLRTSERFDFREGDYSGHRANSYCMLFGSVAERDSERLEFSEAVKLAAHETKVIHFAPFKVDSPRLWWPAQVGPQNLYPLDLAFETGGKTSDISHTEFGIREFTSELDAKGHRLFHINGKNILIRGAGYTFDMLLMWNRRWPLASSS